MSGTTIARHRSVLGEVTPDHLATDTDTGPLTDVAPGIVTTMTPLDVGRSTSVVGEISDTSASLGALVLEPTPRVEVSAGLARRRAATVTRILGGRYRLGRQLGAGGYGAVFAAEDTITGERVAIKVLSPAASTNQELIIRFHREAIAASRVRHPHIVNVADFDVDDDDGHYIVMEQLDGCDLAQRLAESGRFAAARALTIAAQCARGLAAAHRVGVLHRDLKPANIFLVRREGGGETVKVIDFGISKLTPIAGDYTDVTSASKVVGTPSYMSPEQARGACLDARTDVYALGVVLFEMLVGERPFTGRSPLEILGNHLSAPRVAPSTLRGELADCPGLDALVLRALSADANQRFASMEAFGDALVACLHAFAPDAAKHVTEPTGERTTPTRRVQHDGEATSAVARFGSRSRWLGIGAAVIATSIAAISLMSREHAPASQHHRAVAASPPLAETLQSPARPLLPAPTPSRSIAVEVPAGPVAPDSGSSHEVLITSSPRGAAVYRADQRIGVTPLTVVLEPADETRTLSIHAPGYRRRRIVVDADREHVNVVLTSDRRQKPAARSAPSERGVAEW
jgi:eukaryotic-like serine/threonine-protein kinase